MLFYLALDYPPSFLGSSFLSYAPLNESVHTTFNITILFRPHKDTGLLLYSGNPSQSSVADYFSVSLLNGYVIFQFNPGDSELSLRSHLPVSLDEWHMVTIWREGLRGELAVDYQDSISEEGSGHLTRLDVEDLLYLGGHVNYSEVQRGTVAHTGYVGCVGRLSIRPGYDLDLHDDALDGANIGKCFECPCQEGETCVLLSDDFICHPPGHFSK